MLAQPCEMLGATKSGSTQNWSMVAAVALLSLASRSAVDGAKSLAPSSAYWLNTGPVKPHPCSDKPWHQPCSVAGPLQYAFPCGFHSICSIPPGLGFGPTHQRRRPTPPPRPTPRPRRPRRNPSSQPCSSPLTHPLPLLVDCMDYPFWTFLFRGLGLGPHSVSPCT